MDKKNISLSSLEKLIGSLLKTNTVFAPVKKGNQTEFEKINSYGEITYDYIATTQSPKSVVFPRNETILRYNVSKENVDVTDYNPSDNKNTIIFGARPCDATGLVSLAAIFKWDYNDSMFISRQENTILIGMACAKCDAYCFCTSVGGGPGDTKGMDILLTPIENKEFLVEVVTEKGAKIVSENKELFNDAAQINKEKYLADVKKRKDFLKLNTILPEKFNNEELWLNQSLRCIGCGACAYVCPACACFDIQDETKGTKGKRVKCWDSCGFRMFTLHTSGHNPREVQSQRWRQRIMHKFAYMPERQNVYGCLGCGRCSRACPVDMNIAEHLEELS